MILWINSNELIMSNTIKDDFDKTHDDPNADDGLSTFEEYWNHKQKEWAEEAQSDDHDPDRDYDVSW